MARRRTRRRRSRSRRRNPTRARTKTGRFRKTSRRSPRKRSRRRGTRRAATRKTSRRRARPRVRRRSRRPRGRLTRPRLYVTGKGRRRRYRRGTRSRVPAGTVLNPFKIPTMKQAQAVLQDGLYGLGGYVGVNAVVVGLDRFLLGKWKSEQAPLVAGLVDIVERIFAIGVVTWAGGQVFKGGNARRLIAVGGAINVAMSTVKIANAQWNFIPAQAAPLLNGYEYLDGDYMGDYIGMSDWMENLPAGSGSTATGQFSALASMGQDGAPLI